MTLGIFRSGVLFAGLSLCTVSTGLGQESPIAEAQRHQREANEAYRAGDYEQFTRSLERALELNSASFATRYNLACGYARTGRGDEALDLLDGLAQASVDFGMAEDPDLESLRDRPRFREIVALLQRSIVPIRNSEPRRTVDQIGIMPEGIAIDEGTGRLFFGSMRTGDIYVVDGNDQLSRFATLGSDARRSAIGLTVDEKRNLLWVIGTHFSMAEGFDPERELAPGVFAFDLDTGRLRARHLSPDSGGGLNDVAVGPAGDVFVSGSQLQVLRGGTGELEPVRTTPELPGSNGLAPDPKAARLFVSVYAAGIGVVDLESGDLRYLEAPEDTPLAGIDGLYWHEGDLVAIQNGIQPWRLLRLSLNAEATAVEQVRTIEFATEAITPMTGAISGDEIHYVGRGPAPEVPPTHFEASLAPFLGKTLIRTAPLD